MEIFKIIIETLFFTLLFFWVWQLDKKVTLFQDKEKDSKRAGKEKG